MDGFYLGAYWGSRPESPLRCAERLAECIAGLAVIDGAFGLWFRRSIRKAAAKTAIDIGSDSLRTILEAGANRRDFGGEAIPELGLSIGLWNRTKPTVGLAATVGAYSSCRGILNSFVLDFPPPAAEAMNLYEPRAADAIFNGVVAAWDPDWATWTSHALRSAQDAAPREPVVGWLTYLGKPVDANIIGARSWQLSRGTSIRIGSDVSDAREPSVLQVRNQLAQNGALTPIP